MILLKKATSHEKLLNAVKEHAKFGGVKFTKVWSVLKDFPIEDITEKVTWHWQEMPLRHNTLGDVEEAMRKIWKRSSRSDNVQAEGNLGARLLVETFPQWCGSPTYVYFFRSIPCTLVQVPRLRILLVVMQSCPLTLHFLQICATKCRHQKIDIANHKF